MFGSGGDGTGFTTTPRPASCRMRATTSSLIAAGPRVVYRRHGRATAGVLSSSGAASLPAQQRRPHRSLLRHRQLRRQRRAVLCPDLAGEPARCSTLRCRPGPFHRLDLACQGEQDATWKAQCQALLASRCPDCASRLCQIGNGPRSLIDLSFSAMPRCSTSTAGDLTLLMTLGPAQGPNSKLDGAPVRFLTGKDDSGGYAPLQTALHDALKANGANVEILYITGAPHEMDTTTAGANAIYDALSTRCIPRTCCAGSRIWRLFAVIAGRVERVGDAVGKQAVRELAEGIEAVRIRRAGLAGVALGAGPVVGKLGRALRWTRVAQAAAVLSLGAGAGVFSRTGVQTGRGHRIGRRPTASDDKNDQNGQANGHTHGHLGSIVIDAGDRQAVGLLLLTDRPRWVGGGRHGSGAGGAGSLVDSSQDGPGVI